MIPTQDPSYTATRLLRHAQHKPKTAHFGLVRGRKPQDRLLGASMDKADMVKALPQETLTVHPDMHPGTLAASIAAIWARIADAVRKQEAK